MRSPPPVLIERNARHQAQLIEDWLDVSRILQGKLVPNFCPVDLVAVVGAAIASIRLSPEAKSIQIETRLEPEVGPVLENAAQLQQARLEPTVQSHQVHPRAWARRSVFSASGALGSNSSQ